MLTVILYCQAIAGYFPFALACNPSLPTVPVNGEGKSGKCTAKQVTSSLYALETDAVF